MMALNTAPVPCFLCKEELVSRTQQAKKLLLFEKSGKKYLDLINDIAEDGNRLGVVQDEIPFRKAYICHNCCGSLDRWKTLKRKAEEKRKLLSKLDALFDDFFTLEQDEPLVV